MAAPSNAQQRRRALLEAAGVKVISRSDIGDQVRGREITACFIDDPEPTPARPMRLGDYLELLGERIDRAMPVATMLMVIAFLLFIAAIVLLGLAADLAEGR